MHERVAQVRAEDFICTRILASAFIRTEGFRPAALLGDALREWGGIYDADPVSLPLPPEVPGEIPSVILSSRDNTHRLEMARERINILWLRHGGYPVNVGDVYAAFAGRLACLCDLGRVEAGRLGAVVVRVADHPQPGMVLAQHFCRDEYLDGPLNRPEGFELHAHKVFTLLQGLQVNSWMRLKTAKGGGSQYRYAVAEQDINTLLEDASARHFSEVEMRSFFAAACAEFDVVLGLYFPCPTPSVGGTG